MKLVLHIGMPKAGSTALQRGLQRRNKKLRQRGIVFPAGGALPRNHNMLVCGILAGENLPRLFRQTYANDRRRMRRDVDAFMEKIREVIVANAAGTVILSGEMMFRQLTPREAARLKRLLRGLADEIEVVAYVRSPANYYISRVQQALKASALITPLRAISYRDEIESYAPIADRLTVAVYDRSLLTGGDIAHDFLSRIAPGQIAARGYKPVEGANASIPAEGMDILQRYRAANHPDGTGRFTPDTAEVIRTISRLDAGDAGFTLPVAHDHVRAYLESASVDLLWLRDRFDAVFPDVDYAGVGSDLPPPDPPERVSDICPFDAARGDALMMAVLHDLSERVAGDSAMQFKAAMPETEEAPRRGWNWSLRA